MSFWIWRATGRAAQMARKKNNFSDLLRHERTNVPEVVFAPFKDDKSLVKAVGDILDAEGRVLVTKCSKEQWPVVKKEFGKNIIKHDEVSGTIVISKNKAKKKTIGSALIISAGSSDYFVAEEAAVTAEFFGMKVHRHYDCGVAGVHRIKEAVDLAADGKVDVVIVVAGMEGALPSIVAGLVKQPLVAVPTSVGYGAGQGGVTALMAMLNSCSPGIVVVNIDNGFGAAAFAYKVVKGNRDAG